MAKWENLERRDDAPKLKDNAPKLKDDAAKLKDDAPKRKYDALERTDANRPRCDCSIVFRFRRARPVMARLGVAVVDAASIVEGQAWASRPNDGRHFHKIVPIEVQQQLLRTPFILVR